MTNIIHKARRIFNTLQPSFMWWLNKPTESYENDGRRRKGLIWSAKAYYLLSHLSVMMVLLLWFQYPVLSWTGELAFIHDFTAEVYWSVCSAQNQMHQISSAKQPKSFSGWRGGISLAGKTDLHVTEQHSNCWRPDWRQGEAEDICSEAW